MYQAAQFGVDEWNALMAGRAAKDFKIDWSTRSVTVQLDLNDDIGTAAIPEGGYEARPSSQTLVDGSLTFILLNSRFTFSKTSEYIRSRSPRAVIADQLKYQAKKKLQGLRRKVGDMFYGFSTGTVAKVSSVSTDDIVLKDLYGIANLGGLTSGPGGGVENRQCTDLFRAGDYIAVLNPTGPALRANGIVEIDSITAATNIITGADVSSITSPTASDLIVFANNLENTTLAGGTERNLNLVGLLDMCTTDSVHGVATSSYPKWAAGYSDTAGGRFTGVKLRKMKQGINNNGGGTLDTIWIAQGVDNDLFAQAQAGLRYSDAFDMEIDGDATSKGVKKYASRLCPDGYVFGYDSKNSVKKGMLLPEPGDNWATDDALDKLQDISGTAASLDFPLFMFTTNRANMAYISGATQQ
jgi:hypothetical protein